MASAVFDFAICGSTPFAQLLAGLLASLHGKSVCLVADGWSPYRLPRGLDLSVMPATRPETWTLLKRGASESLKLLGTVGKNLYERVDPLFVAETRASADYLSHLRWMAVAHGFAAERAVDRTLTGDGAICRIRDAAMLIPGRIEPALDAWLEKLGVRRFDAGATVLSFPRTGRPTLEIGSGAFEAETAILADDAAILGRLGETERHRLFAITARTSLVTESAKPLSAAFVSYLDREVLLLQRATKGAVTALADGAADTALVRIGASLPGQGQLRRAGQTVFRTIATTDGAPLIGRLGKGKATVIAGLGMSAAFLAPIVARTVASVPTADERSYFDARDVSKAANRQSVAETALPETTA
jgi:hypothetical protein